MWALCRVIDRSDIYLEGSEIMKRRLVFQLSARFVCQVPVGFKQNKTGNVRKRNFVVRSRNLCYSGNVTMRSVMPF